jgi:hypothetical protein
MIESAWPRSSNQKSIWVHRDRVANLLSLNEIREDPLLRWFAGALLLGFYVTFNSWLYSNSTTREAVEAGTFTCWPIFQSCESLIWMSALPNGYSQTTFFMALFGLMLLSCWALIFQYVGVAHTAIAALFLAKIYLMSIDYSHKGNYDYYHNAFCFVYIFLPRKTFFLKFTLAIFYFLSTMSKRSPSWLAGEYFTSLQTGLPIFPAGTEPLMTNVVIVAELSAVWLLFSRSNALRLTAIGFFVVFHLYSGILVGYRYPATVMPALLILFGPWASAPSIPSGRGVIPGWIFVSVLVALQLAPRLIEGDERSTLEGNYFGLYMFEANHQCFGTITIANAVVSRISSSNARHRCDPYEHWFKARNQYCKQHDRPVKFVFNHSVNGRDFRRIVDADNICTLEYSWFKHNDWIKDGTEAEPIGRPLKSNYR